MVRGDVHAITLPRGRGHVQLVRRLAVIVQADDLLALSTIVLCPDLDFDSAGELPSGN